MSKQPESLGIEHLESVHLFVRDLERVRHHYVHDLGFSEVSFSKRELESEERARVSVLEAGDARLVLMEPLGSTGDSYRFLQKHPDGVGRVVLTVENAERALRVLLERGATPLTPIERRECEGGHIVWFDIATPIGDTLFRFVQHTRSTPSLPGLMHREAASPNRFGISGIDHITCNFLTLEPALMWMTCVLGFARKASVKLHTRDLTEDRHSGGTGMKSVVMWDPESGVTFVNQEPSAPFFYASQVCRFCERHGGPGVQRVALSVSSMVAAVQGMREQGVQFMSVPDAYYEQVPQHLAALGIRQVDEELSQLRELQIGIDGSPSNLDDPFNRYLLQIGLREAAQQLHDDDAGPLSLELIQRRGDRGFGNGYTRARFESIEREQTRR